MATLIIKVNFEDGIEMEERLNKAIDDLTLALKKKGLIQMELDGLNSDLQLLYKVTIQNE